jgi:L-threonylcarbamoyladenylate synthase
VASVDPNHPREDRLREAAAALDGGGVVALPTETVYGLSVDAFSPSAVLALNRLKGKAEDSPALLLLSGAEQLDQVTAELPPLFDELVSSFWPGPLTLVVPAGKRLPDAVGGGRGTVAVRVPGLMLPRRLAAELGRPITGVSANRHGEPPCRTASDVAGVFPDGIELILDGGPAPGGLSSTIIDLNTDPPRVLREGLVPLSSLRAFLPDLQGDEKTPVGGR